MNKFIASINVYFSKRIEIKANADNIDDFHEGILQGDYDAKIYKAIKSNKALLLDEWHIDQIESEV